MTLALALAVLVSAPAEAKKGKKHAPAADPPAPPPIAAPAPAPAELPAAAPADPTAPPRLEKQAIGECGCSVYAPPGMVFEAPTKTEDGSDLWSGSASVGGWEFGVIAVRFADGGFPEAEGLEEMAESYLDFLNDSFGIMSAAGYGRGHTLESNPAAKGIIDFWKDAEGDEWAVKCWVDQKKLAVLFVAGPGPYPIPTVQQLFLDGFRFE